MHATGVDALEAMLASPACRQLTAERKLIDSRLLGAKELEAIALPGDPGEASRVLEHPRVAFPSSAVEWSPEQLLEAGRLTLEIAERLLGEGLGLKDASPDNVLFRGPDPVFVDTLSIERRRPDDPLWLPEAQFQRNFVLPLLANRLAGLTPAQIFSSRRDGLEPEDMYALLSWPRRLTPLALATTSLPTWLGRLSSRPDAKREPARVDPARARFTLEWSFRRLRRQLEKAGAKPPRSHWRRYEATRTYSPAAADVKERVVREALAKYQPAWVLDIGSNTGRYSMLSAESGSQVVAIDTDAAVVGALWTSARARSLPVLPLVIDLARPTPGSGWRNSERTSFLDRAEGRFDGVLALAVLHHLLVTNGIPLPEVLDLLARLAKRFAVIEFVPPTDPMFRVIARGREGLHQGLTWDAFERACRERFHIVRRESLPDSERRLVVVEALA